jgi:hypothetical protein
MDSLKLSFDSVNDSYSVGDVFKVDGDDIYVLVQTGDNRIHAVNTDNWNRYSKIATLVINIHSITNNELKAIFMDSEVSRIARNLRISQENLGGSS